MKIKFKILEKNFLINYYALLILLFFIIYNFVFKNLKIGGGLYQLFMIGLILINAKILIQNRNKIKYKNLVILFFLFLAFFSKNSFQCFFDISNIIILCSLGFKNSLVTKIISIVIILVLFLFLLPLTFLFLLIFGTNLNEESDRKDIYKDQHYYCQNHYEVYTYSLGAMDSFHYSIGKYYEILNMNGVLYISYHERNDVSKEKYEHYLKNHKCKLVEKFY